MKKARVVIGANFGDEAKGLVTDYFAAQTGPETLVVRFNGGAQAGHTVTTPDGRRHVFSHMGSGSFTGSATYLSRFFVCNPLTFLKELTQLLSKNVVPDVYIDPRAPITTPYDMMINQCIEESRGIHRHGSCGMGFGETLERHQHPSYALSFADLSDEKLLLDKLAMIAGIWAPRRLRALGLNEMPEKWRALFTSPRIIENFAIDARTFLANVRTASPTLIAHAPAIVFEGAQGLLLDQDYGHFPHVTRSHTGLKNVVTLAQEFGIDFLETYYLTRCYLTRHGAGPLPYETQGPIYEKITDPTNIPNAFQGSLRFAPLNIDLLQQAINADIRHVPGNIRFSHHLSISCMDHADSKIFGVVEDRVNKYTPGDFLHVLKQKTGVTSAITVYGPTRKDVIARPKTFSKVRVLA